jgi:hypothetical protein
MLYIGKFGTLAGLKRPEAQISMALKVFPVLLLISFKCAHNKLNLNCRNSSYSRKSVVFHGKGPSQGRYPGLMATDPKIFKIFFRTISTTF